MNPSINIYHYFQGIINVVVIDNNITMASFYTSRPCIIDNRLKSLRTIVGVNNLNIDNVAYIKQKSYPLTNAQWLLLNNYN